MPAGREGPAGRGGSQTTASSATFRRRHVSASVSQAHHLPPPLTRPRGCPPILCQRCRRRRHRRRRHRHRERWFPPWGAPPPLPPLPRPPLHCGRRCGRWTCPPPAATSETGRPVCRPAATSRPHAPAPGEGMASASVAAAVAVAVAAVMTIAVAAAAVGVAAVVAIAVMGAATPPRRRQRRR